jgi:peroxiredoxin
LYDFENQVPKEDLMSSTLQSLIDSAEQECLNRWKQGPTRIRWKTLPPQIDDPAPDFSLPDQTGKETRLSSLWHGSPLLLIFWRHFGCGCGIDRAARLKKEYDNYVSEGARVAIIGQGEPDRTQAYIGKYDLPPIPFLSDPEFRVYAAYGLLEGKPSQIVFDAPEVFQRRDYGAFEQLAKERREAGRPLVDNPWQLPGEFVVDNSGILRLTYRYNYCEDFPDPRVLVTAIREAAHEASA